jgi:hypothetical protein
MSINSNVQKVFDWLMRLVFVAPFIFFGYLAISQMISPVPTDTARIQKYQEEQAAMEEQQRQEREASRIRWLQDIIERANKSLPTKVRGSADKIVVYEQKWFITKDKKMGVVYTLHSLTIATLNKSQDPDAILSEHGYVVGQHFCNTTLPDIAEVGWVLSREGKKLAEMTNANCEKITTYFPKPARGMPRPPSIRYEYKW